MKPRICLGELTWVEPAIQSKTSTWSEVNLKKKKNWPRWALSLSPRYGQVILVSWYLVLTGVNWSKHGCLISKMYAETSMILVTLADMEGLTYVRTVDDVIAIKQISRIDGWPYFVNYGAPGARGAPISDRKSFKHHIASSVQSTAEKYAVSWRQVVVFSRNEG